MAATFAPRADVAEVHVALDGSALAERALRPGRWLASRLEVPMRLVEVVDEPSEAGLAHQYLASVAARTGAETWTVLIDDDPAAALAVELGDEESAVPVLASRGRNRSGELLGSVAFQTVQRVAGPVVLVGPQDGSPGGTGPVVVTSSGPCDRAIAPAASWAASLGAELLIVPDGEFDQLTVSLLEFRAQLVVVAHPDDAERLSQVVHRAPCPVLVLPARVVRPLPERVNGRTMTGTRITGEATMIEPHMTKGAAKDAARREHHLAEEEAALAAMELRAAKVAPTPWQQTAHRLAAEVHADAAQIHKHRAAVHDLEAAVEAHGVR